MTEEANPPQPVDALSPHTMLKSVSVQIAWKALSGYGSRASYKATTQGAIAPYSAATEALAELAYIAAADGHEDEARKSFERAIASARGERS